MAHELATRLDCHRAPTTLGHVSRGADELSHHYRLLKHSIGVGFVHHRMESIDRAALISIVRRARYLKSARAIEQQVQQPRKHRRGLESCSASLDTTSNRLQGFASSLGTSILCHASRVNRCYTTCSCSRSYPAHIGTLPSRQSLETPIPIAFLVVLYHDPLTTHQGQHQHQHQRRRRHSRYVRRERAGDAHHVSHLRSTTSGLERRQRSHQLVAAHPPPLAPPINRIRSTLDLPTTTPKRERQRETDSE